MSGMGDRARAAARARHLVPVPELVATELQETAARDLGRLVGEDVNPLHIRQIAHRGTSSQYHVVRVAVDVVEFEASYLWGGGDYRYHTAGGWRARRLRSARRWWRRLWPDQRVSWRRVDGLADVADLL